MPEGVPILVSMLPRCRYPCRWPAGLLVLLIATIAFSGATTTAADASPAAPTPRDVACSRVTGVFRNFPILGTRLGEISEPSFSYCLPAEDTVRLITSLPIRDRDGRAWYRVGLNGPTYGRRVGWVAEEDLVRPDRPRGAAVGASAQGF